MFCTADLRQTNPFLSPYELKLIDASSLPWQMEFTNNDAKVNVTLSDIYVGGKMLTHVQAEKIFNASIALQRTVNDSTSGPSKSEKEAEEVASFDGRAHLNSQQMTRRQSILTIQADNNGGGGCIMVPKNVLFPANADNVETLRNSAHYYAITYTWRWRTSSQKTQRSSLLAGEL